MMPAKIKRKKVVLDPRLETKISELRKAGHTDWYIESFTKGWLMAAAKMKKSKQENAE